MKNSVFSLTESEPNTMNLRTKVLSTSSIQKSCSNLSTLVAHKMSMTNCGLLTNLWKSSRIVFPIRNGLKLASVDSVTLRTSRLLRHHLHPNRKMQQLLLTRWSRTCSRSSILMAKKKKPSVNAQEKSTMMQMQNLYLSLLRSQKLLFLVVMTQGMPINLWLMLSLPLMMTLHISAGSQMSLKNAVKISKKNMKELR